MKMNIHQSQFISNFKKLAQNRNYYTVFNDFINLVSLSCWQPFFLMINEIEWVENEQKYKNILAQYDDTEQDILAQLLADMINGISVDQQNGGSDWIGTVYQELNISSNNLKQFFTPYHIAKLMSQLTYDENNIRDCIEKKGYCTINDPCCGAGAFIIAFANTLKDKGYNYQKHLLVVANDIDDLAANMTFVQLSLNGIPAIISQKDTLTLQNYWTKFTPAYFYNGWFIKRHNIEKTNESQITDIRPSVTPKQQLLF